MGLMWLLAAITSHTVIRQGIGIIWMIAPSAYTTLYLCIFGITTRLTKMATKWISG